MRTLALIALVVAFGRSGVASADVHAEMAAALAAQADLNPGKAVLPVAASGATHLATAPAGKHVPSAADAGRHAAQSGQNQGQGQATALAHRAQEAAMSAAGQAQAKAAKDRASHPHPTH